MNIEFSEVRERVSLTYFFDTIMATKARPMHGTIRYHSCPNCGDSSGNSVKVSVKDDNWRCFSCKKGGDVIDAAAFFWKLEPRAAAAQLLGVDLDAVRSYVPPAPLSTGERDDSALAECISILVAKLPKPDQVVYDYLTKERAIPMNVIEEARRRKILFALPSSYQVAKEFLLDTLGREKMEKAGLWRPDAKAPAIAFRPLMIVSFGGQAAEFRLIRKPKDQEIKAIRYGGMAPWAWQGTERGKAAITEGAIDLLSFVALDGGRRSVIGCPGCENWKPEWFAKLNGWDIEDALDDDDPGNEAREKLLPVLRAVGGTVSTHKFPKGAVDINDELRQKVAAAASH